MDFLNKIGEYVQQNMKDKWGDDPMHNPDAWAMGVMPLGPGGLGRAASRAASKVDWRKIELEKMADRAKKAYLEAVRTAKPGSKWYEGGNSLDPAVRPEGYIPKALRESEFIKSFLAGKGL
jgi:hypothetical protein